MTGAATSADAPTAVKASPSQPKSKPKRERKLTDEQLAAHREEQAWCGEVLAELCRRLDVRELPQAGRQKVAAKWFYRELHTVEDGQKRLWACYDLTKREPFWQHQTLLLSDLTRPFPEYRRDPKGYRERIEAAGKPRTSGPPMRAAPLAARPVAAALPSDPWA